MKGRVIAMLLALALLLSSCGANRPEQGAPGQYSLYFRTNDTGTVLGREYRTLPQGEEIEELVKLLLAGPEDGELVSPFPRGTALNRWRLEGDTVALDLSEAYGGLSGVDQTLADACLVLTLCQLDQVERISLTVEGRPRPFQDHPLERSKYLLELPEK